MKASPNVRSIREFCGIALIHLQILANLIMAALLCINSLAMACVLLHLLGALYPLELYVVMPAGIYHYNPARHELKRIMEGDKRPDLQKAAMDQESCELSPGCFWFLRQSIEKTAANTEIVLTIMSLSKPGMLARTCCCKPTGTGPGRCAGRCINELRVAEIIKSAKNETPLYLFRYGYPKK